MSETVDPRLRRRARGARSNAAGRYERHGRVYEDDGWNSAPDDEAPLRTQVSVEVPRRMITYNRSPDLPFDRSINPYRGCEHGCAYCYARPYHEFLGFSAGLDFETKIIVKPDAPKILRAELSSSKYEPQVIAMSGVTDIYQPIERKLKITRGCLEVLAEFRNPVGMITKNALITRDIDLLAELAEYNAVGVSFSITTLDENLRRRMEPRTSITSKRFEAMEKLNSAGIPAGVMIGPVIPGLNDSEIIEILKRAGEAGARSAGYTLLRLPYGVRALFEDWLETHYPNKKIKVMRRIDERPKDYQWERKASDDDMIAKEIAFTFRAGRKKASIVNSRPPLSIAAFRRPGAQRELF